MTVEIDGVGWDVGDVAIIRDVSATIPVGSFTGLIGPNGSGKTTLLHVLAGLRKPSAGTVLHDGEDVHGLPARVRARRIALLEQHATTTLDLTVRQVVELGRTPHRGRWPGPHAEGAAEIDAALALGRVEDLADRRWLTLSGGERQRTQLARALAQQPSVLMLDEPTNHLDLGHQIDFLRTVRGLGITTIAALHNLDLAAAFCDRLIVMHRGRVAAEGPVDEVLTSDMVATVFGVDVTIDHHAIARRTNVVWHA
jgi:iron complex transport system ATP-binding protein